MQKKIVSLQVHQLILKTFLSILFTLYACCMTAGASSQNSITLKMENVTVQELISEIEEQSKTKFLYDSKIDLTQRVTAHTVNMPLEQLLRKIEKKTNLVFNKEGNNVGIKQVLAEGYITGNVMNEDGNILRGATITVEGRAEQVVSNEQGNFTLTLPAGTYNIEVSFTNYQPMQVTGVQVTNGKTTPLDVTLIKASLELEGVVVTATYSQASAEGLYNRQKNLAAMSDGVSADLIKKTSDNNVAQVLKRVSGVTIDNGKYVTVRGMSERYNNVQLNGASLPSTEPNRRNFAFDVIPTGLVDNITITKTFTPDLPGEFTGGLVEVNTLSVPEKKLLNVSVGTGWNSISTGKDLKSNKRFSADYWLGEIDKRQWYTGRTAEEGKKNTHNAGQMNTWAMRVTKALPLQNYSITAGLPVNLGSAGKLGLIAALTYRHEERREDITESFFITRDSLLRPAHRYIFASAVGAVANVGWQMPGHKISWRNLFNSRFTHTNTERQVYKYYENYAFYQQHSMALASRLVQTQLDGEHKLFNNKLILSWNGSYNKVMRTNPDDRMAVGGITSRTPDDRIFVGWSGGIGGNVFAISDGYVMYSRLDETKKNVGVNIELPFVVEGNRQSFKIGYLGTFRNADFQQQYLRPMDAKLLTNLMGKRIEDVYDPENFNNGVGSPFSVRL